MVADEAAVGNRPQKNSLGRMFRRKAHGNEKEGEEEEALSGKFSKGLHAPGACKRTASVEALAFGSGK